MKLYFDRPEGPDIAVLMEVNEAKKDFQYPEFIQRLYDGDLPVETEFSEKISADEQEKLRKMVSDIESATVKKTDSDKEDP